MTKTARCSVRAGLTLLAATSLACAPLLATETVRYTAQFGSRVQMDGTSNIHNWTVNGLIVTGTMEVSPDFEKDIRALTATMPIVEASIPVRSLKSGNRKMDEIMQDHMNMKAHPRITYHLTDMKLQPGTKATSQRAEFATAGDLTVAGATRSVEMPALIERQSGGKLSIKTSITLKMTDFGITPPAPKLAMGLIKTGDDVVLEIEWVLRKKQ